jgi:hypothetical protein
MRPVREFSRSLLPPDNLIARLILGQLRIDALLRLWTLFFLRGTI